MFRKKQENMFVYFDTVKRKRPVREGGELVQVNWSTKQVLKTLPIYPADPDITEDPNPRGNSRGGKGIIISQDEIFVGSYHTINVYDHSLNFKRTITNHLFVNIHEICFDHTAEGNIWVSSTAIDCAVLVNQEGKTLKTWWPREEKVLQQKYGLHPMKINKQADNRLEHIHSELEKKESHTHFNSVSGYQKQKFALLNRLGAVVQFEPELNIVIEDPLLRGAHSPVVSEDGKLMLVCSSFKKMILIVDIEKRTIKNTIDLLNFRKIRILKKKFLDQPFNKSIFVRGLEIIDHDRILVGISPASILEIDIRKNKLLDFFQYSSDVGDAVHGLVHRKL